MSQYRQQRRFAQDRDLRAVKCRVQTAGAHSSCACPERTAPISMRRARPAAGLRRGRRWQHAGCCLPLLRKMRCLQPRSYREAAVSAISPILTRRTAAGKCACAGYRQSAAQARESREAVRGHVAQHASCSRHRYARQARGSHADARSSVPEYQRAIACLPHDASRSAKICMIEATPSRYERVYEPVCAREKRRCRGASECAKRRSSEAYSSRGSRAEQPRARLRCACSLMRFERFCAEEASRERLLAHRAFIAITASARILRCFDV